LDSSNEKAIFGSVKAVYVYFIFVSHLLILKEIQERERVISELTHPTLPKIIL